MADTADTSWYSGMGDVLDILGKTATTGANVYATIKTADQAADGQKTAGANAAGAAAVQPAGTATTGTADGQRRTLVIVAAGAAAALVIGALVFTLAGRRRR
jgi:hypothetical protein